MNQYETTTAFILDDISERLMQKVQTASPCKQNEPLIEG
jgi:hypothetical protein